MHRSFSQNLSLKTDIISITDPQEIHHIKNVLRLRKGSRLSVFNGQGEEIEGEILSASSNEIQIHRLSYTQESPRHRPRLILACSIPKHGKFEWIIEKATELGADEIIPLKTQRTEFRMTENRAEKKSQRYHTVTVNAAKQCRRLTIPMVHPVTPFMDVIARIDAHTHAFIPCLIGQRKSLPDALSVGTAPHIIVLIGPEGDFTDEEVNAAVAHGAIPITLGPTTLKVETAAISTIAFITLYLNEKSMHPHHTC